MTFRERAITCKTLIALLQGIEGYHTTVELRNENIVEGTILSVDARMNIHMIDANFKTLDGNQTHFEQFYVNGTNVRFVHIPDEIDIRKTIEGRLTEEQKIARKGKFEKLKKNKTTTYSAVVKRKMLETRKNLGLIDQQDTD